MTCHLGEQPSPISDKLHSLTHDQPLTKGKQSAQAKCFPMVSVFGVSPSAMEIGHRIKKARELAGLSQTELANAVGTSRGLVGQWESHRKKPGRDLIAKIADATSVTPAYLLGIDDLNAVTIVVTAPDEIALIRRYRTLPLQQRQGVAEIIGLSATFRSDPTSEEPEAA